MAELEALAHTVDRLAGEVQRELARQQQHQDELRQAHGAAQAASAAKSRFVATMGHEIRTPLNAVIGLSQLMMDTALDARQREYVGQTLASARHLLGLMNDVLDLSKIEAGRLELDLQAFWLDEAVDLALTMVAGSALAKGIELRRRDNPAARGLQVCVDP
ncbi:MAG: histidine kinase dimerization/phospho-acceptor domain-containing protein, partial [Rubrivivax sp.]|nr:histidine kinase dimerization/phospho-acceptor domain-containing protein [Rubrivivax sp.]